MKVKKIFCILMFLFMIFLSGNILGVELNMGETYTFELRDVPVEGGLCITAFTGATCDDESIISIEEIKTGVLFFKTTTGIKITGLKAGTTNITLSGSYDKQVMQPDMSMTTVKEYVSRKISITVKDMAEEMKKEKEEYENAYKTIPAKDAVAKDIKEFILSDEKNNGSKALKQVAKTDKEKIQAWYDTVTELISSDRHYASEDQYGSTKNKLKAILDSYDNGTSVEDAVDSVDTSGAAELVDKSYDRLIVAYTKTITGNRESSTFDDILDNVQGYNKPSDLDSGTATKIETAASKVLSAITSVGVVAAIVILAVLGVKYMLGSVEEKAEYKKDLIPYLVGACLLFGISVFVKIFMQWGETLSNW